VLGPDGLSLFDELRRREASHIIYAFDLIEHDGADLRKLPFLDRKAALARLLRATEAGILFNEHIAEDGAVVRACLPAWRRRHRVEKDRQHLSIGPVPCLDQGPQSGQHRCAAGAQRDVELASLRQRAERAAKHAVTAPHESPRSTLSKSQSPSLLAPLSIFH
jgi:hypothetical protein